MNSKQKSEMGNPRKDGALKQAARWVAKMFGYKAESKLGRFVWRVFATSAAIVALLVAIALVINVYNHIDRACERREYQRMVNSSPLQQRVCQPIRHLSRWHPWLSLQHDPRTTYYDCHPMDL